MATQRLRFLLLATLILVLVGCGTFATQVESVSDTLVNRTLRYFDEGDLGPVYTFSLSVPEDWVGQFETANVGNKITFTYAANMNERTPIFIIEALSESQYWEQIGSYPGIYRNIVNSGDTYFVYSVPTYFVQSNLGDETYQAFVDTIPAIVNSFEAELISEEM